MEAGKEQRGFRDLIAWQKADKLASLVFRACRDLPPQNRWLVDQILRCAVSVPANIAEGHGRGSKAELSRCLDISRGSLAELEYYLHFLKAEEILPAEKVDALEAMQIEASKVLFGLWRSLKAIDKNDWNHTGNTIREESELYTPFKKSGY